MLAKSLRNAFAVVVTSLALLAGVGAGVGQAAINAPAVTDDYLFNKTLSQFSTIKAQAPYRDQLDWSSDGCSWSPDNPFGFKFLPACHRHDFGYRNYKRQGRFTESTRLTIDNKFKSDLYNQCAGNWTCNRTADLYYQAVREFGAS